MHDLGISPDQDAPRTKCFPMINASSPAAPPLREKSISRSPCVQAAAKPSAYHQDGAVGVVDDALETLPTKMRPSPRPHDHECGIQLLTELKMTSTGGPITRCACDLTASFLYPPDFFGEQPCCSLLAPLLEGDG